MPITLVKASNARETNWKRHSTDAWLNAQMVVDSCPLLKIAQSLHKRFSSWLRATIGNCFLCTFQSVPFMKEVKTRLSIPELIKRDDGRFSCSVSHTTGVKAKYGLGNEWRLGTKTANEWNTQQYCVRWGEKYFQFWVNAICESYLGLYFSGMGIFEKFQFLAKSSLAID